MKRTALILCFFVLSFIYAGVCIWRFPDKDIQKLFPQATGYKTEIVTYNEKQRAVIEKELGSKLDDDETQFNFYRILKDTIPIGLVLTHSAKGQYGAIEVVIGLNNEGEIIGLLIQRDRERLSKELRARKFLGQFIGKTVKSDFNDIVFIKGAETATKAVILSVRKMLIVNQVLGSKPVQVQVKDILSGEYVDQEVFVKGKIELECSSGCWFILSDKTGKVYVDLGPANFAIPQWTGKNVSVIGSVVKEAGEIKLIGKTVKLR